MHLSLVASLALSLMSGMSVMASPPAAEVDRTPQSAVREPMSDRDMRLTDGRPTVAGSVMDLYVPPTISEADLEAVRFLRPDLSVGTDALQQGLSEVRAKDLAFRRANLHAFWVDATQVTPDVSSANGALVKRTCERLRARLAQLTRELRTLELDAVRDELRDVLAPEELEQFVEVLGVVRRADASRLARAMTPGANAAPLDLLQRWAAARPFTETEADDVRDIMVTHLPLLADLYDRWDACKWRAVEADGMARESRAQGRGDSGRIRGPALRALAATESSIVAETRAMIDAVASALDVAEDREFRRAFELETLGVIALDPYESISFVDWVRARSGNDLAMSDEERAAMDSASRITVGAATGSYLRFWSRFVVRYATGPGEVNGTVDGIRSAYREARTRSRGIALALARRAGLSDEDATIAVEEWLRLGDTRALKTIDAVVAKLPHVAIQPEPK
ncbi:MAG: hypothetical protein JNM94_08090 [Phycisphaerae bacterium]|nr:hypothetical protein [Phycisphaerae bacterium]